MFCAANVLHDQLFFFFSSFFLQQMYCLNQWFSSGMLDGIPADLTAKYTKWIVSEPKESFDLVTTQRTKSFCLSSPSKQSEVE